MTHNNFMEFFLNNQEALWLTVVFYDLLLAIALYKLFGKYGLYCAVILGIILGNLQGGKVSQLELFGWTVNVSMGAILYSGIYFATDLLNERFGKAEANRAVLLGFIANIAVMVTLWVSIIFIPSNLVGSTLEVVSQTFDVWFFHYLKEKTKGRKLWIRNNLSTITSQLIDTLIYQFTWVIATGMSFYQAFLLASAKYVFKIVIALIDTLFIYIARNWKVPE